MRYTLNFNKPALFFTILLICFLAGAEVDLFIPSFPELQKVFNLSPFLVQLTLSANFLAYCICSLFAGAMGDRFNRKSVIIGSLVIFTLGSLLCVFANHFSILILGRFLQGTGMAGPAVLAYVLIADQFPLEKQPAMMGILNGIVTMGMAFAPVIGSYVNLYFNWRGNFVVLLILSILSLICGILVLPNRAGDPNVSLSPKTYLPLLSSPKLMTFILGICFMAATYWIFIGMAPILYMEGMNVDLKHFGYYQGAIALVFSVVSIISPQLMQRFGQKKCMTYSLIFYSVSTFLTIVITLFDVQNPMIITSVMLIFAATVVFPCNILFPISLEVVEGAKGRAAALMSGMRLLLTAGMLEVISYFYVGKFLPIGLGIFAMSFLALAFFYIIFSKGWAHISDVKEDKDSAQLQIGLPH